MRYSQIRETDISNGEGIGVALFVQGCNFRCSNCFNPETHDFNGGKQWTEEIKNKFLKLADRPYIKRISFLGGEPLAKENIDTITKLAQKCKKLFPDKKIWLWSGSKFEKDICHLEITKYIDYIVDGRFIDEQKDISLRWRGSANQHIWKKENNEWMNVTKQIDNNP